MTSGTARSTRPFSGSVWIEIISRQQTGFLSACARGMLWSLVPIYAIGVWLRNRAFDLGVLRQTEVPATVISVGNLTAGGTGKTPTVAWVVRTLQSFAARPAIISRGYGGDGSVNDEKLVLDQLVPGVPHLLNPDRIAGARELLARPESDRPGVITLDDAFQHRRIARDFDLVLVDCLNPWGYGSLFPRGLLREPLRSLKRASCVLLTRCDQVDLETQKSIEQEVRRWTGAPLLATAFQPTRFVNGAGEVRTLEEMQRQYVAVFCGIGNPSGFRRTLTRCGMAVPEDRFRIFPDHHRYTADDLESLKAWAKSVSAESLLVTQKDLVKLPAIRIGDVPVWALEIELKFVETTDETQLKQLLRSALKKQAG